MNTRERVRQIAGTLCELPYETWNFGDSVAFEGLVAASARLGEPQWAAFARGWCRAWATRAIPYRELDHTAPGWAMVRLCQTQADPELLTALLGLAEHLVQRPTIDGLFRTWQRAPLMEPYGPAILPADQARLVANPPPGSFLDCLHFDPPFLTALGRAADRPDLVRCGVDQALGFIRVLQQPNGLFDHFILDGQPGSYGPGWGRGQGWALLGLLHTIDEVEAWNPEAYSAELAQLRQAVGTLIDAMIGWQRTDGHWDAVVDVPSSGVEGSTAAFMAAGFLRAARLGVHDSPEVVRAGKRALDAVTSALDDQGVLGEVSVAVMACTEPTHYENVPRGHTVPWGQGPALLALGEACIWEEWEEQQ